MAEQARSEASALLSRIRSNAISTASNLIDTAKDSDKDKNTGKSGAAGSTPDATGKSSGMGVVTYATVTKAYEAQSAQRSA